MSEKDEKEAITRLRQGDISGLETLVRLYQVAAVQTAYLITFDRAQAEDIVQAAFLRVFERIHQFDSGRAFKPWFLRIVVNDAIKTSRRHQTLSLDAHLNSQNEISPNLNNFLPGPAELFEQAETRQTIREALRQLSPEQRAVIVLRYFLELSESQMADQLQCPPGTIKWRLHAARTRLKELLGNFFLPDEPNQTPAKKNALAEGERQ